jgi:hypothetical protein
MQMQVWATVLLLGLGMGTAGAQTPRQNQPPSASPDQMNGMDMGQNKGQGKAMDMSHCMMMAHDKAPIPAGTLRVAFGEKSADWTLATLAALPHKTVTVYNEHAKANQTYSGVPLMDLLTRLGVPSKPHGADLRLFLVAEGSDGYQAVYSVAEVNPNAHDATVIVADALAGNPLAAVGPFQLVATGDKLPTRWVRNLVAVRVQAAD